MDRNLFGFVAVVGYGCVALRKESVDRNAFVDDVGDRGVASLSARRAWIEITQRRDFKRLGLRRSPQGERG